MKQLHVRELGGPRMGRTPVDQHPVKRCLAAFLGTALEIKHFRGSRTRAEHHAKLPEIIPITALEGVLPSRRGEHAEPCLQSAVL